MSAPSIRRRFVLFGLASLAFASKALSNQPDTLTAEQAVTTAFRTLQSGQLSRTQVLEIADLSAISRFVLGRHARRLDEIEFARFEAAFTDFVLGQIIANQDQLDGHLEIVSTLERRPDDLIITTTLTSSIGQKRTVRLRILNRDNGWKLIDVEISGLWVSIEQRAQISAMFDRPGSNLTRVIAELRAGASQER